VEALIKKPYTEGTTTATSSPATGSETTPAKGGKQEVPAPASGDKPTFKKPSP
jgi:hypothetical protein